MLTVTVVTSNLSLRMKMALLNNINSILLQELLEKSLSIIIMKNNRQDEKLNIDYFAQRLIENTPSLFTHIFAIWLH